MRPAASIRRLSLLGIAIILTALLSLLRSAPPISAEGPASPRIPRNASLPRARNPIQLAILTDPIRVVGWLSGAADHTGEAVTVGIEDRIEKIKLERGNTFAWPYRVEKPTRVLFSFGKLQQAVTLTPPSKLPPCVFFVIDRGAYRPKQTLRFAGFLRQLDERGEFVPLPGRTVEATLAGEQEKTVLVRLKLTSDEQGRITGDYTFADSDPLDRYRLSIPDYRGAAHVTLAEYRKSKTRLAISGQPDGGRLMLHFRGSDYLDRPLPGATVQLVAQVVRDPQRREAGSFEGRKFAYTEGVQPPPLRPEDLSSAEQALAEAEESYQPITGLSVERERQVVTELKGRLELNAQGKGAYSIELKKAWQQSGYTVVVQGVMIDANGREERCTRTLPLMPLDGSLSLSLSRSSCQVNEPISVTACTTDPDGLKGSANLVVLRLAVPPPRGAGRGEDAAPGGFPGAVRVPVSSWDAVRRTPVLVVPFKGDTAMLRLPEPGAYVLQARFHRPDGRPCRQEIGCVVHAPSAPPPLTLRLDRDTYSSGDTLTGTILGRYADACVLLTLRDSTGLRLWRPLRLSEGRAELKLKLPADLRYGCSVAVRYADAPRGAEAVHVASQIIHVEPSQRLLTIHSKIKPICEPGEKAILDLEVNRREPVDLIVSVYDKALRSIAPDASADVSSFYLADDRIHQTHARDVIRQRLGSMALAELVQRVRNWPREHPEKAETVEAAIAQLVANKLGKQALTTADVAQLLCMVGVRTRALADDRTWELPTGARLRQTSVAEWLETPRADGWRLHYALAGDTLLLTSYHATARSKPWSAQRAAFLYYGNIQDFSGRFRGNFQGSANLGVGGGVVGFGGAMGGLGGIGGIAGLGGGGFNQPGGMMGFAGAGTGPSFLVQAPAEKSVSPLVLPGSDSDPPTVQVRRDFADSAYWNARVRTDAEGKARIEFKLPDSLTSWQVVVTAITPDLHVGRHEASFQTAKAIMIHPLLPRFFTEGDRVQVSAEVRNRTAARQNVRVCLKVDNGTIETPAEREVALEPEGRASVFWTLQAGAAGFAQLLISAESAAGSDAALKRLPILRAAVEHVVTRSGFCKDAAEIRMPDEVDPQKAVLEIRFAPTLTADLIDTLDYLVDYPYGCVEQTMSRFLPAIKVAQVLKHFQIDHPGLMKKLPGCVAAGIKRLLELQLSDGGWGWNGSGQTHEMMTPYALYGLLQAEKAGYPLGSETAIVRGLNRLRQFIDRMGPAQTADRIYCMYVYGHRHELPAEWWRFIATRRAERKLSDYALALALDLAEQQNQKELAGRLATDLRARAVRDNDLIHWRSAGFSRWGDDPFEITAVALKALVAHDKEDPLIAGVLAYFTANKRGNHWNSTKDTALIVYALCDYLARQEQDPRDRPRVAFRCNDGPAHDISFAGPVEGRTTVAPAAEVKAGLNRIVFPESSTGMMYRMTLRYRVPGRSAVPESQGIRVKRRFWLLNAWGQWARELNPGESVPRGAYLESVVEATPMDGADMRFVLVENPRPAACEVVPVSDRRFDQHGTACVLREEREALIAYHHEQTSGRIVDRCVLHAELAGDYLVPAAHVEMMYRTEVRGHSGAFRLRVRDR